MGRGRDQADVAGTLAPVPVVGADGQQAGQLPLRPRVGLDGDPVVAGDLGQPLLQLGHQPPVAGGILGRGEGVQVGEAGQRHRLHLGRGVQLHRAGAQRDHPAVQRVVAGREPAQVAEHRGLAVVRREHLMREVRRGAAQCLRERHAGGLVEGDQVDGTSPERLEHPAQRGPRGGLRGRDADPVSVHQPQVHAPLACRGDHLGRTSGDRGGHGVEELLRLDLHSPVGQRPRQDGGVPVSPRRDRPQPLRAVVDGVHRGHDGQQDLGGADVGRRLVPPDVLLPGLQGQPVGRPSLGVDRDAHQAPGQVPLEALGHRHVPGVRSSVEQGDSEPLGGPDHHVGAHLSGRLQEGQRQQVGRDHGERIALVGGLDHGPGVDDPSGRAGVLHQHPRQLALRQAVPQVGDADLDPHRLGTGAHHLDGLRQGVGVDDERAGGLPVAAADQGHRLRRSGPLVQQGRVRRGQAGQVADHRLEVEQRLETSLGDLGLVRRVGGVPAGVLEHVAPDDRRRERRVVAQTDHRLRGPVGRGQLAQLAGHGVLGGRLGELGVALGADAARDGGRHQLVQRGEADGLEHRLDVRGPKPDVALDERQGGVELGKGGVVRQGGS